MKKSIHNISMSIEKSNKIMEAKARAKAGVAKRQLDFDREKYWMEQAKNQFSLDSDAFRKADYAKANPELSMEHI